MASLTSAGGIVALLDEKNEESKLYALKSLNSIVDQFWAEVSDSVTKLEVLFEDRQFKHRKLAALIVSKIYYHLGEYDDALVYSLHAEELFEKDSQSEYVQTMISKCVDKYIEQRVQQYENQGNVVEINAQLTGIIERLFQRCYESKEYQQVIGIALEARRIDIIQQTIKAGDQKQLLSYVFKVCMTQVQHLHFRNEVLNLLITLFHELKEPDYHSITQCYVHLNDPISCSKILQDLMQMGEQSILMAYQIAFDLEDMATQEFLNRILDNLGPAEEAVSMEVDGEQPENRTNSLKNIRDILAGDVSIKLYLEFLYRNNHTDLLILKTTKGCLESRNSMYHSVVTFANAFMHAGTTVDEFLRQNLEWLSRASNWSKFSATAALGVIHKGQVKNGLSLLAPYLPSDSIGSSAYSEGGSLYALGLIHTNHGASVLDYLKNALKNTQSEVVQHGACLGLGVAGMATGNEEIFEELKNILFTDSAVAGEAAGIAIGLVMLGTASEKVIDEMLQYAHDTQHEKIIRGLAIGIALIMYGRQQEADNLVADLLKDKDPILRYGGVYTIGMAYRGTGSNAAIRKLLHIAVSDVNDDVRRGAVTSLGFILFRDPQRVPRVVQLLSESYNPHVRYGATFALGIACAGTGSIEAVQLLEPMTKDPVDFVRQGALIALAMILIQQNEASCPKVVEIRALYEKVISDKHEDPLAKMGAVLAQGIIDAGGRNVTLSLHCRGHPSMSAVAGMAIFCQFWYWYPLTHFLSMSFTPTALICLNSKLEVPKFSFVSNAKPSLFAYPPETKPPSTNVQEKIATAVLSTTAKAKARAKKSDKERQTGEGESMDIDAKKSDSKEPAVKEEEKKEDKKLRKKKEESFENIENLTRVLPEQLKHITFKDDSRYTPIKPIESGIVVMIDKSQGEPEELIEIKIPQGAPQTEEAEAPPPEPFVYEEN